MAPQIIADFRRVAKCATGASGSAHYAGKTKIAHACGAYRRDQAESQFCGPWVKLGKVHIANRLRRHRSVSRGTSQATVPRAGHANHFAARGSSAKVRRRCSINLFALPPFSLAGTCTRSLVLACLISSTAFHGRSCINSGAGHRTLVRHRDPRSPRSAGTHAARPRDRGAAFGGATPARQDLARAGSRSGTTRIFPRSTPSPRGLAGPGAYFFSGQLRVGLHLPGGAIAGSSQRAALSGCWTGSLQGLGRHVIAARVQGAAGRFVTAKRPGYTGVLTAMAPGAFSAALNQAPMRKAIGFYVLDWAVQPAARLEDVASGAGASSPCGVRGERRRSRMRNSVSCRSRSRRLLFFACWRQAFGNRRGH